MIIRRAIIALVAAGLGVWVAVAAAQGGFGAGETGTVFCSGNAGETTPCPRPHRGSGGVGNGGGGTKHHHHASHGGSGEGSAGEAGQAHPGPAPGGHGKLPNFTFSVRLLPGAGAAGVNVTGYSTHIQPPQGAQASCSPQLARRANIASRDQVARIHLRAPPGGWCDGHYRVTVTLTR